MDVSGGRVWQQAAGNRNRDYAQLCLEWDVILNGPGNAGPWPDCQSALGDGGVTSRKRTDLKRFCKGMEDGHLVVLRTGTSQVIGVGEVVGTYEYHPAFGDVDGWDLQHVRRVRWLWRSQDEPKEFDTYTLKLGDTTQLLDSQPVEDWLRSLQVSGEERNRPLRTLPRASDRKVGVQDITEFLFERGVASSAISTLVDQIEDLIRIAKWYRRTKRPSEHETVAYLVVPLLRALGWPPQRMAVEWKRVDVALFARVPRDPANLKAVVEAKRLDQSCLTAVPQASGYAKRYSECRRLVVTDGIRYAVYAGDKDFSGPPHAYLNLTRLQSAYPIYDCLGAQEALYAMAPEWEPVNA